MDLYPYCLWRWLVLFDINLQLISELESESVSNEGDKLSEEVSTALQWQHERYHMTKGATQRHVICWKSNS